MWFPLACSISASNLEPTYDTELEYYMNHNMFGPAYRIYFVRIQPPLLDFFHAHPHQFRNIVFVGLNVHHGDTENQGTMVAIENGTRNRIEKGTTEGHAQTGRVCSGKSFLSFCPGTQCHVLILCVPRAVCRVKLSKIPRRLEGTDTIPSIYLTRTFLTVGVKTSSSRHCIGNVWCNVNQYCSIE